MEVKLMAYTPDPVWVCALAAIRYCSEPKVATVSMYKNGHDSVIEHASSLLRLRG